MNNKDTVQIAIWKSLLAGGIAGVMSRTMTSPMERAKILLQIDTNKNNSSTFKMMLDFYKKEGRKGLFRGNGMNCLRVFPYMSIQYFAFQGYKNYKLNNGHQEIENLDRVIGGFISGSSCVIATYPMDLLKSRLTIQSMQQEETTIKEMTRSIYHKEGGLLGFYRGMWPTLCGVVPFVILNFNFYESMKFHYTQVYGMESFTSIHKLTFGALAGSFAQVIIYPFDLLRRRFQIINMPGQKARYDYNGIIDALKKIYLREGINGMYKGLVPNLMKVIPATAIQWWVYEVITSSLK